MVKQTRRSARKTADDVIVDTTPEKLRQTEVVNVNKPDAQNSKMDKTRST